MNQAIARGRPDRWTDCLSVLSANCLDQGCNGWTCAGTIFKCGALCVGGFGASCSSCVGIHSECKDCFTKKGTSGCMHVCALYISDTFILSALQEQGFQVK